MQVLVDVSVLELGKIQVLWDEAGRSIVLQTLKAEQV